MPEANPQSTQRAAMALGSNLPSQFGEPADNLREAVRRLGDLGTVTAVSSFYATAPVGYVDQPEFVNAACLIETPLGPLELLRGMLDIERAMGRDRTSAVPKGPRVIDLDLLLYASLELNDPELVLPHPAMHERRFVLEPLAEIASAWVVPVSGNTVAELLARLEI
jgi:2-amino-4-hydroxy-6-hydroxymethyldihydropteridine diphosphokinase